MIKPIKFHSPPSCINDGNRKNTIWSILNDKDVELFNQNVLCLNYKLGETVFMQGQQCRGLYFVANGLVGIRKIDYEGQTTLIRVVGHGGTLGYRPFLAKQVHRANAEIIEDSRICFINAASVRRILQSNHELGVKFLERIAQELGEVEERLSEMAVLNVDIRLIHLLILYHDQWGTYSVDGSFKFTLPITREDMASMVGAHPDSVTRALRLLESKGVLQADGRLIHIDKFDRLTEQLHTNLA